MMDVSACAVQQCHHTPPLPPGLIEGSACLGRTENEDVLDMLSQGIDNAIWNRDRSTSTITYDDDLRLVFQDRNDHVWIEDMPLSLQFFELPPDLHLNVARYVAKNPDVSRITPPLDLITSPLIPLYGAIGISEHANH